MSNSFVQVPSNVTGGNKVKSDLIGDVHVPVHKMAFGDEGTSTNVSASNPLPTVIDGVVNKQADQALVGTDVLIGTHCIIQGKTTAGGGSYVDVKVNPSGALSVSVGDSALPTGAATEDTLSAINGYFKAEDTAASSGDKGIVMLAQRYAADTPTTDADGDYTILKLDEEGRLKVSSKPASYADITGDITAVQATIGTPVAGGTVSGDVSRASNIMAFCTGTFSTVNCTFEGSIEASGDTNWFGIQAVRSNANTIETATGNLSAQPAYGWELSVNGLKRVRVRCTARTSGTQSWRFVLGTYATEPIPAAQVSANQPVTLTSTTITSHTPTTYNDTTANLTGGATFTGTSRDAGATNTMRRFCAVVAADQSGTLFIQCSNDNTTWRTIKSLALTAPNAFGELEVNVCTRYHRVVYTNGASAQGAFLLNSAYHRV